MNIENRLTPNEAADYLTQNGFTVKRSTMDEWRSVGRHSLPYIKLGKYVFYQITALDAFLASKGLSKEFVTATQTGERIVREPECLTFSGLSRSERARRMKKGTFPQSFSLGGARCVGWRYSELQAWLAGLQNKGGAE